MPPFLPSIFRRNGGRRHGGGSDLQQHDGRGGGLCEAQALPALMGNYARPAMPMRPLPLMDDYDGPAAPPTLDDLRDGYERHVADLALKAAPHRQPLMVIHEQQPDRRIGPRYGGSSQSAQSESLSSEAPRRFSPMDRRPRGGAPPPSLSSGGSGGTEEDSYERDRGRDCITGSGSGSEEDEEDEDDDSPRVFCSFDRGLWTNGGRPPPHRRAGKWVKLSLVEQTRSRQRKGILAPRTQSDTTTTTDNDDSELHSGDGEAPLSIRRVRPRQDAAASDGDRLSDSGIEDVEVVRLNEQYYTREELAEWRRLQLARLIDFIPHPQLPPSGGDSTSDGTSVYRPSSGTGTGSTLSEFQPTVAAARPGPGEGAGGGQGVWTPTPPSGARAPGGNCPVVRVVSRDREDSWDGYGAVMGADDDDE